MEIDTTGVGSCRDLDGVMVHGKSREYHDDTLLKEPSPSQMHCFDFISQPSGSLLMSLVAFIGLCYSAC